MDHREWLVSLSAGPAALGRRVAGPQVGGPLQSSGCGSWSKPLGLLWHTGQWSCVRLR